VTEEEEDEEYLKEEEGGLGNTRLVTQPSCKLYFLCVCIGAVIRWLSLTLPFFMSMVAHACIHFSHFIVFIWKINAGISASCHNIG